jgi:hypothetical protein
MKNIAAIIQNISAALGGPRAAGKRLAADPAVRRARVRYVQE